MSSLGFSYAQAARGLTPSSNLSSNPASSASSEHGTGKDNSQSATGTLPMKSIQSTDKLDKEIIHHSEHSLNVSKPTQQDPIANEKLSSQAAEPDIEVSKSATTQNSSIDENHLPSKSHEMDEFAVEHTEQGSGEKSIAAVDTSSEKEKTKETDDDWEKVSIPSVAAEKELKAAPIPTFNVWQKRMETAQAKSKENPIHRIPAPTAPPPKTRSQPTPEEHRKKSSNREEASTRGSGQNITARTAKDSGNSISPRSTSQQNEKSPTKLPPVDAESWPTPESAITEPGRRLSVFDKTDRTEVSETAASGRKNKWQALPFVPTVKFETQVPGRRGGRNSAARGRTGASGQSDRTIEKSEPGNMGPPPLPKNNPDQDRGRKGNASRSARASSVPIENNLQGDDHIGTMKGTVPLGGDSSANPTTASVPIVETPPRQELSRSSSQNTSSASKDHKLIRQDTDVSTSQNLNVTGTASTLTHPQERASLPNSDLPRTNEPTEKPQSREWTKDRSSNTQKSDNWRSERRSDRTDRAERSERGRGTSYRGRGNHSSFNNNPSFTSPLPQNGFDSVKQSQPEPRSRQSSQQFTGTSTVTGGRNNPRSQSIPIGMISGNFYQSPPAYSQTLPPLQTDMNFGGFGQMPNAMPSGIMSAMPYNEPLNGYALFSMAVTQLEYYFSVDNLCKDMFLRKHMDSQGFVPLRVIADFKRIKQMLGDDPLSYDRLRGIAQQARNIEYVIGEDGADRLRNRDDWEKFVLPMEDRLPQAQNEGPEMRPGHFRQSTGNASDFEMMNGGLRSAPPYINGFDDSRMGYPTAMHLQQTAVAEPQSVEPWSSHTAISGQHDETVSPITSPLSKIRPPDPDSRSAHGNMTNGHGASMSGSAGESTFPDEGVMALKVVVKDPDYEGDEDETGSNDEPSSIHVSGLRGGAGSPERFERFQSLRLGGLANTPSKNSEQTMYFSQEGPPQHLMRPGYIHEDYLNLREKAISQRADDHFDGATGVLYPLWAEFLPRPNQFNVGMYEDFKTWALEDMERGNDTGKKYLVNFYDTVLCAKAPMSERVAADIVGVARSEVGGNRPTWMKLRAAWRNGATNLKTRKRLTELLTSEEQAELERGT